MKSSKFEKNQYRSLSLKRIFINNETFLKSLSYLNFKIDRVC